MKRRLALALAFMLLLLAFQVFAEGTQVVNDDEFYEVAIPETFRVITVKNMGMHQDYLAEKGVDVETLTNNFQKQGITAYGYTDDRKQELFVTVTTNKSAQNIFSIDRFTQEELDAQIDSFMDTANEKQGIYPHQAEYVQAGGVKFLRGSFENRMDEEKIFRVAQYYTMANGRYYMVSLYDYAQTDFTALMQQLDEIMQEFHFTKVLQPEKERQTQFDFSKLVPVFIMAALVIGIVVVIIVMRRSDKKRKKSQ